ncbi:MAG: zinc-binding metallopeptidase family protein [Planctomycetota bacterium]
MPEGPACSVDQIELLGDSAWDESFAAMFFLEEEHGPRKLAEFLAAMRKQRATHGSGGIPETLFREVFRKDSEQLDAEWRRFFGWPEGPGHRAMAIAQELAAAGDGGPGVAAHIAQHFERAGLTAPESFAGYAMAGAGTPPAEGESCSLAGLLLSQDSPDDFVLFATQYRGRPPEGRAIAEDGCGIGVLVSAATQLATWQETLPVSVIFAVVGSGAEGCEGARRLLADPPVALDRISLAVCIDADAEADGAVLPADEGQTIPDREALEALALGLGMRTEALTSRRCGPAASVIREAGVPTASLLIGPDRTPGEGGGSGTERSVALGRACRLLTGFVLTGGRGLQEQARLESEPPRPVDRAWDLLAKQVDYSTPFATVEQVVQEIAAIVSIPYDAAGSRQEAGPACDKRLINVRIRGKTGHQALSDVLSQADLIYGIRDGKLVLTRDPSPRVRPDKVALAAVMRAQAQAKPRELPMPKLGRPSARKPRARTSQRRRRRTRRIRRSDSDRSRGLSGRSSSGGSSSGGGCGG